MDMSPDEGVDVVVEQEGTEGSRVTVAISLHNYRDHIAACLDSVSAQTIDVLDVVVVDDSSTDGGGDVVRRWLDTNGRRFNRYALLRHARNRGLAAARNAAFGRARTEFAFVLDADNMLYPRCLQQLVASLDNCAASFSYCYLEEFGAATGLQNIRPWSPDLQHGNTIDAMVLLRKQAWEAAGGYSMDMPVMGWEDYDLWFKIARMKGWGVQVPEILARYFVHSDSMLRTVTNPRHEELWAYLRSRHPEFFRARE